jgi:molecular chaperone HtpG
MLASSPIPPHLPIPPRLNEILETDHRVSTSAKRSMSRYLEWLRQSTMPFFPGYTDHGPDHISAMIQTAEQIIATESFELLTATDIAMLILAVLLHDVALHLTKDGFLRLVKDETNLSRNIAVFRNPEHQFVRIARTGAGAAARQFRLG